MNVWLILLFVSSVSSLPSFLTGIVEKCFYRNPLQTIDKARKSSGALFTIHHELLQVASTLFINTSNQTDCEKQLTTIALGLLYKDPRSYDIICPLIDAVGKPGAGILKGNRIWMGSSTTCDDIAVELADPLRLNPAVSVSGRMHIVSVIAPNNSCTQSSLQLHVEVCLPDGCEVAEALEYIGKSLPVTICKAVPHDHFRFRISWPGWVAIGAWLFILALAITASLIVLAPRHLTNRAEAVVLPFSLPTTIDDFLRAPTAEAAAATTPALYPISVVALLWLVIGEAAEAFVYFGPDPLDVRQRDFVNRVLVQFRVSFDTLLFCLGLFLAERLFSTNRGKHSCLPTLARFFAGPVLAYYLLILTYTFVVQRILFAAFPILSTQLDPEACEEGFFWNLVFLNNFQGSCLPSTAFVATTAQIVIMSLPLFYLLSRNRRVGICVGAGILILSVFTEFAQVFWQDTPPTFLSGYDLLHEDEQRNYLRWVYFAPWTRCKAFVIGIVIGMWAVGRKSRAGDIKPSSSKFFNAKLLSVAPVIAPLAVLSVLSLVSQRFYTDYTLLEQPWRAIAAAVQTPLWCSALVLIVVTQTLTGYFNKLAHSCRSIARLNAAVFLVREPVRLWIVGWAMPFMFFASIFQLAVMIALPCMFFTYISGVVLNFLVICPLQRLLYGSSTAPK